MNTQQRITVGELIEQLMSFNPKDEVIFGGSPDALHFYRLKDRGGHVQFEFNQQIYRTEDGKLICEDLPQ